MEWCYEGLGSPSGRAVQVEKTAGATILWWEPAQLVQGPARRPVRLEQRAWVESGRDVVDR